MLAPGILEERSARRIVVGMRILVLSNLYPPHVIGGYEQRCRETVDALRRRGHDVHVLCSHAGRDRPDAEADGDGVRRALIPVGFFGFPWRRAPALFDVERHNRRVLADVVEEHRPELIYCWNLGGIGKGLLGAAAACAPVACDISDEWLARADSDPYLCWRRRHPLLTRLWPAVRRGIGDADCCIDPRGVYCTSASIRRRTAAAGWPVHEARIIPCGIDAERFRHEPSPGEQGRLRCLYAGRIHPDKGVHTACAAVAALPGVELDVFGAGDGGYDRELRERYDGRHGIRFHGGIARAELPATYPNYDCLVFPSEWEEPFGRSILEAGAAGRCIVCTDAGGPAEYLAHGRDALLYPPGRRDALAASLMRLRDDPALRIDLGRNAQRLVLARFTLDRMVDAIEEHLVEVASSGGPRTRLQLVAAASLRERGPDGAAQPA